MRAILVIFGCLIALNVAASDDFEPTQKLRRLLSSEEGKLTENHFLTMPRPLLLHISKLAKNSLGMAGTCRYLRSLSYNMSLKLTLPENFCSSVDWEVIIKDNSPFTWPLSVIELDLRSMTQEDYAALGLCNVIYYEGEIAYPLPELPVFRINVGRVRLNFLLNGLLKNVRQIVLKRQASNIPDETRHLLKQHGAMIIVNPNLEPWYKDYIRLQNLYEEWLCGY